MTRVALASVLALGTLVGCAGTPRAIETRPLPAGTVNCLPSPLSVGGSLDPQRADDIGAAHRALIQESDIAAARSVATRILQLAPELGAARLLSAEAALAASDWPLAATEARAVLQTDPADAAASLVLGCAEERRGDIVAAGFAYRDAAVAYAPARESLARLGATVEEILTRRVSSALERSAPTDATAAAALLEEWAPNSRAVLEARRGIAAQSGDRQGELAALREITDGSAAPAEMLRRRGTLELEVGDAAAGLRIFQELESRFPDDPEVQEQLRRANFLWRLNMMPGDVKELADRPELSRGDLAALLYWVLPEVRYGRVDSGRIANDVFDHPYRDEIVRVVNLGLMTVDDRLHRFEPREAVTLAETLAAVAEVFERRDPAPACTSGAPAPSGGAGLCRLAESCQLLGDSAACLPGAYLSGRDAVDVLRRTLEQFGGADG